MSHNKALTKTHIAGKNPFSDIQIHSLEKMGLDLSFSPSESNVSNEGFDCEILICNNIFSFYSKKDFPNLKYIQFMSVGLDRVPDDIIHSDGLVIKNISGCFDIPISEFVIMQLLNVLKSTQKLFSNNDKHLWEKNYLARELHGAKVCIYGCGKVGSAIAKLLKPFDCTIIGFDIDCQKSIDNFDCIFDSALIGEKISDFDIVIISCPLTKETFHRFGQMLLSSLKANSILVNISRGAIIDTNALFELLSRRRDLSAILDVFEDEPLDPNSPLWNLNNVLISPHCSYCSEKNNERMSSIIISNISDYLNKQRN